MKQKSGPDKAPAEQVLKDIRRQTRPGSTRLEERRSALCWTDYAAKRTSRKNFAAGKASPASMYYGWSKEFLEARQKRRLAGDTARAATSGEVKDLRREATALKEVVADLTLENRLLKKSMSGDGENRGMRYPASEERPRSSSSVEQSHLPAKRTLDKLPASPALRVLPLV